MVEWEEHWVGPTSEFWLVAVLIEMCALGRLILTTWVQFCKNEKPTPQTEHALSCVKLRCDRLIALMSRSLCPHLDPLSCHFIVPPLWFWTRPCGLLWPVEYFPTGRKRRVRTCLSVRDYVCPLPSLWKRHIPLTLGEWETHGTRFPHLSNRGHPRLPRSVGRLS